ncbi:MULTISPECIES: hypothetical protein [Rhizobium]|nr:MULTISPECIES: hypothetical protein [Rhizobium]MBO9133341.1 hypothetical protein [Rhizobium sp. B209b/85]MBZ5761763.1 hypothetical protein [Rhizobium sp. VS19-DR96]MBZ5767729.1 hypothetical protein [Rhizobium sp. VS19-DR129.2]MBZ5773745.1 hypothetical protein [Rhizobium sp. VS19-DRK62.2]MBZ5786346.1 hypothetical protein [Rhizobium sp. VS19-DR121]
MPDEPPYQPPFRRTVAERRQDQGRSVPTTGEMDMAILARRFTIITLVSAVFAISFSAAVLHSGGSGSQSHFGANFTCLQSTSSYCSTVQ